MGAPYSSVGDLLSSNGLSAPEQDDAFACVATGEMPLTQPDDNGDRLDSEDGMAAQQGCWSSFTPQHAPSSHGLLSTGLAATAVSPPDFLATSTLFQAALLQHRRLAISLLQKPGCSRHMGDPTTLSHF